MASDVEIAAMRQAIILSALGLGTTSPNPPVGCVILDRHGQVVGTGFHRRKGEAHAEVNALSTAGTAARGGTAVVTLEPCNHVGVTPACRQALLDAGITRVVIGVMDPTSRGEGGAAVMAAAGVDVEVGVLSAEVLTVLGSWLTATARRAPYLTLAYARSVDNAVSIETALLSMLRSNSDVVVTDLRIEEGIGAGHSAQHFRLDDLRLPGQHPAVWLADAYDLGIRTALLSGRGLAAESLLALRAVDQIVLAVPRTSEEASSDLWGSARSCQFEIADVASWPHGLLIRLKKYDEAP
jgi:diaminohydroxyphosphoribosylaminopyrimidine deaminase / 5-amino-6-(5-phosphoribosylamino)uracil reductase